jgi:hypothetical protein
MAIRLLAFVVAICWSVNALGLNALGQNALGQNALGQKGDLPPPPARPQMPRPAWAPPTGEPIPGAAAPDADPLQLLENSSQVQAELGLTSHQKQNIHLVAIHNQSKLEALSHRLEGQSEAQMREQIDSERCNVQLMIWRELTPKQIVRLQQMMLQLEGPGMAILDRQIARHLQISPDQGQKLGAACQRRSEEVRRAVKPSAQGENSCTLTAENRSRVKQIRLREDRDIVAQLEPEQQAELIQLMGPKINLESPLPPDRLKKPQKE